jgi:sphinganine-1-phosphate aldolase
LKYKVGLHVDCCLGGFYLPFAKRDESLTVPKFDFSVEGVSSISIDTHKVK